MKTCTITIQLTDEGNDVCRYEITATDGHNEVATDNTITGPWAFPCAVDMAACVDELEDE